MMNPGERPTVMVSTPGSFLWTVVYELKKPAAAAKPVPSTKTAPAKKSAAAEGTRTWKSVAGTTIDATLVKLDGDVVVLEKKNGERLRVPLEKLSAPDRKWALRHPYLGMHVRSAAGKKARGPYPTNHPQKSHVHRNHDPQLEHRPAHAAAAASEDRCGQPT